MNGMVNVSEKDSNKMFALGYAQEHSDTSREDTFRLKGNQEG